MTSGPYPWNHRLVNLLFCWLGGTLWELVYPCDLFFAAFVWAIIFVVFVLDLLFALNQLLQFLQVWDSSQWSCISVMRKKLWLDARSHVNVLLPNRHSHIFTPPQKRWKDGGDMLVGSSGISFFLLLPSSFWHGLIMEVQGGSQEALEWGADCIWDDDWTEHNEWGWKVKITARLSLLIWCWTLFHAID